MSLTAPTLPRFSPIAKIPPLHLASLPVPRVPFVSQVCQLAIMMTPAAAIDTHPRNNYAPSPGHILCEAAFTWHASQPPPYHHPYRQNITPNSLAAADPFTLHPAAA